MNMRRQAAWDNSSSVLLWRSGTDAMGQLGLETPSPNANAAVAAAAKRMAIGKGDLSDLAAAQAAAANSSTTVVRPTRFEFTCITVAANGRVVLGGNRIASVKPPVMDPLVASFVLQKTDETDPEANFQWNPDSEWKQVNAVIRRMPKNTNHATVNGVVVNSTDESSYVLITSFAKEANVSKSWKDETAKQISGVYPASTSMAPEKKAAISDFMQKGGAVPSTTTFGSNSPIPITLVVKLNREGTMLKPDGSENRQFDTTTLTLMYPQQAITGVSIQTLNNLVLVLIRRINTTDDTTSIVTTVVLMSTLTGVILGTYDLEVNFIGTNAVFSTDGGTVHVSGSVMTNAEILNTEGFVMAVQIGEPEISTGKITLSPHTMTFPNGGIVRPFSKFEDTGHATVIQSVLQSTSSFYVIGQRVGCYGTDYGDIVIFAVQVGTGEITMLSYWSPPVNQAFTLMSSALSTDGTQILMGGQIRKNQFWMSSGTSFVLSFGLSRRTWAIAELPAHSDHMSLVSAVSPFPDAGGFLMAGTFMSTEMDNSRQGWVGFSRLSSS
jgi:hypothetical protein